MSTQSHTTAPLADSGLDLETLQREELNPSMQVASLAHEFSKGVATYRVETEEQLRCLMQHVEPALRAQGVKVVVRTNNQALKAILRGADKTQLLGARPPFVVQGQPAERVLPDRRGTQMIMNARNTDMMTDLPDQYPGRELIESNVACVRSIPAAGLDPEDLERWLQSGGQAKIRVENARTIPMKTWVALRRMQRQYGKNLGINAVQKEGENVRQLWAEAGQLLDAAGVARAPVAPAKVTPSFLDRMKMGAKQTFGSLFRSRTQLQPTAAV